MTPKDGTIWHDRVAARSLLSFSWRRPVRRAASVRIPILLVVPEADAIAPVPAASRSPAAHRGPNCSVAAVVTTTFTKAEEATPKCCERRSISSIATRRPQPSLGCKGRVREGRLWVELASSSVVTRMIAFGAIQPSG
jgi:hypothetical protein